jgi:galactose mutarotase-like enzyme
MNYNLENESLRISVNTLGAELQSIIWKGKDIELLWQGDAAFWHRRAPVLFPTVGKLGGNRYRMGGREYPLPQHGFARDMEFEIREAGADHLRLLLRDSKETMARFPCRFEMEIAYGLEGPAVAVTYAVRNPGDRVLSFCLGAHPGFRCPLREGERFDDYELRFEVPETLDRHFLRSGLIAPETEPLLRNSNALPLSWDLFEKDAIVLKGVRSRWVELRPRGGGPGIRVSLEGWPFLGLWTKPGAHFLCIEPWHGLADPEGFEGEFADKEGAVVLQPGDTFERSFTIEARKEKKEVAANERKWTRMEKEKG